MLPDFLFVGVQDIHTLGFSLIAASSLFFPLSFLQLRFFPFIFSSLFCVFFFLADLRFSELFLRSPDPG